MFPETPPEIITGGSVEFVDEDPEGGMLGGKISWSVPDGVDTGYVQEYLVVLAEDANGMNNMTLGIVPAGVNMQDGYPHGTRHMM